MDDYTKWKQSAKIKKWIKEDSFKRYGTRITGFWYEILKIPAKYFESILAYNSNDEGVSNFLDLELCDAHEYWGAMRDRIPASAYNQFLSEGTNIRRTIYKDETSTQKLSITVPDNICFIRTVQDLSKVSDAERKIYVEVMEPVLDEGIMFLSDELETCLDIKKVTEIDANADDLQITSVLAYFESLAALEKWASSHPAHLSIFNTYFDILKMQDGKSDVNLWHEVSVLKSEDVETFYCYCQPDRLLTAFNGGSEGRK